MVQSVLLDWTYYENVGHAVEGIAAAAEYYFANRGLEISLLLNSNTPYELTEFCPWISRCYPIDVDDVHRRGIGAACLRDIPRIFDYVIFSERIRYNALKFTDALRACYRAVYELTTSRIWKGCRRSDCPLGLKVWAQAPYRLQLPGHLQIWARSFRTKGPLFSIMLAGSSRKMIYPSLHWWDDLFSALTMEFPGCRIAVLGRLPTASGKERYRTATHPYSEDARQALLRKHQNVVDGYGISLPQQIAIIEASDVFISPHTGFAFLSPSVGTPWVAVSGYQYADTTFAGVPFFSAIPSCPAYPCVTSPLPACCTRLAKGKRVFCMDEDLQVRIHEIIDGIRHVMRPDFTLTKAVATLEENLYRKGASVTAHYNFHLLRKVTASVSMATGVDRKL